MLPLGICQLDVTNGKIPSLTVNPDYNNYPCYFKPVRIPYLIGLSGIGHLSDMTDLRLAPIYEIRLILLQMNFCGFDGSAEFLHLSETSRGKNHH